MLAALTVALLGFACPPVEEALPARALGEQCGGTCNTFGECASGLECHVEKPKTSPMSFAILMGGGSKSGVCREVVEERRSLQLGGRPLAGGVSSININDEGVLQAAKFAVKTMSERSNSLTPATLNRIVSAQSQVHSPAPALPARKPPTACARPRQSLIVFPPLTPIPLLALRRWSRASSTRWRWSCRTARSTACRS